MTEAAKHDTAPSHARHPAHEHVCDIETPLVNIGCIVALLNGLSSGAVLLDPAALIPVADALCAAHQEARAAFTAAHAAFREAA